MTVPWRWLGRVGYGDALVWQRARRDAVIRKARPEIVALLEHPAVVTTGRRQVPGLERLADAGIPVIPTERGGLATYHGPGQLVGYPIVDIGGRGIRVKAWMALMERVIACWLQEHGLDGGSRPGFPGVWVRGRKICAVGTHVARGVTLHGFALNLCVDLGPYGLFDPCGITDAGVTSAHLEGLTAAPADAASSVGGAFVEAVDMASRSDYLSGVP